MYLSHFYTVGIRFIYIDISTVDLSILMNITYIDITVVKSCLRPESAPLLFFGPVLFTAGSKT